MCQRAMFLLSRKPKKATERLAVWGTTQVQVALHLS
jgi:hypothetical protein